jgi:hypothetical protein
MDPGSAAHQAARHSASKTRVNALMALRSVRGTRLALMVVMPGLVPGIHVFTTIARRELDGRSKSGHDEETP